MQACEPREVSSLWDLEKGRGRDCLLKPPEGTSLVLTLALDWKSHFIILASRTLKRITLWFLKRYICDYLLPQQ